MENLLPIQAIADKLKIAEQYLEPRGKYCAKIRLELLRESQPARSGKMILVTATTPTKFGEGKTVVSIGLAQALEQIGYRATVTSREPSVGPVFGSKGGATGGGQAQVEPSDLINLNFTGDFPAITAAHNALAALLDSHIHHGNALRIDTSSIFWPRALDMNDRALRHIISGLGGKANGAPREESFVITAASEIMAIMALAGSREDLRHRLNEIVVALNMDGKAVRVADLGITGALMVLLNDAILPNLVQTTQHTPAFVHIGPFANIAHGTSSVLSQKMALQLADFVVNETGFAADLGAEKYFDIVMPASGIRPAAAVLVTTARSLTAQGASGDLYEHDSLTALHRGLENLGKHIENLHKFGVPFVVAVNHFPADTPREINCIHDFCRAAGIEIASVDVFTQGGEGARELAEKVAALATSVESEAAQKSLHPLYEASLSVEAKIEKVARDIYGADGIYIESAARKKLQKFASLGYGHLPVCIAKTQNSLSDNPKLMGAPRGWTLTVTDAKLSAGAGFIVVIAGNMLLMPGLPEKAQAMNLDVDADGKIIGLR